MIKPKKKFGQNFLKNACIVDKIIESIPKNVRNIIEIGAGLGDLTKQLCKVAKLTSYEIDAELYALLVPKFPSVSFICDDANKALENGSLSEENYFLVANLPYYVATKILLNAIDDQRCDGFIVMIQREVAQKFCAKCGSRNFGAISIIAQLNGDIKMLFDVEPDNFVPPPKVMSSVIKFEKFNQNLVDESKYSDFKRFLKIAFCNPRKTVCKNLSSNFANTNEIFDALSIHKKLRPHEIKIALYVKIYQLIKAKNGK